MARDITFQTPTFTLQASIMKIEGEKLYGWTVIKIFDAHKEEHRLVNLLAMLF